MSGILVAWGGEGRGGVSVYLYMSDILIMGRGKGYRLLLQGLTFSSWGGGRVTDYSSRV